MRFLYLFDSVGAGTAHGFGLLDYSQKKEVTSRCTLNPQGTQHLVNTSIRGQDKK